MNVFLVLTHLGCPLRGLLLLCNYLELFFMLHTCLASRN